MVDVDRKDSPATDAAAQLRVRRDSKGARIALLDSMEVLMAMSDEHKAALARGRIEARAIKRYLEALALRKPGRPVTVESLEQRLAKLTTQITEETDPLRRVDLVQKRIDTETALAAAKESHDMDALEQGFVTHAAAYSNRKGITHAAWREAGVAAAVLQRAGIPRTRRS